MVAADDVTRMRTVVVVSMINAMDVTIDDAHATSTPNDVMDAMSDANVRGRYAAGQWSLRYRNVSGDICMVDERKETYDNRYVFCLNYGTIILFNAIKIISPISAVAKIPTKLITPRQTAG